MKRDIVFVCVFMIFGLCVGFATPLIDIPFSGYSDSSWYLMTFTEMADLESGTASMSGFLRTHLTLIRILWVILTLIVFTFILYQLNSHVRSDLIRKVKKAKLIVVILCCLALFCFLALVLTQEPIRSAFGTLFDLPEVFSSILWKGILWWEEPPDFLNALFLILGAAALWLIAGETGWVGDFASWRIDRGGRGLKLVSTFVMGAAVGVIAYYVWCLFSWALHQYYILVREVLVRPGEMTFHRVRLFTYGLMFTLAFSLGIIAGFVTVLAPRRMEVKQRLLKLIVPAVLLGVYIPVLIGTCWYADARYDLGKRSLAEAVGIPGEGGVGMAKAKAIPVKMPILQERPTRAKGYSRDFFVTFELSYENLKKIEGYLRKHKDSSVFYLAGLSALMKGYFELWDTKKAMDQMFCNAPYDYASRVGLLSMLQHVPVTAENEKYLRDFADETKWHIGKVGALRLVEAFMHFGHADEAKKWAEKAKAKGAELSEVTFLTQPVFTRGTVSGAFKVDGVPLAGVKVALFLPRYERPVDVRTTDASGKFTFTNLGKGDYMLAVMTDKETVPYGLPPSQLKVENEPGTIKLDINNPSKNVGNINILTK
jgi:hypothetical protein